MAAEMDPFGSLKKIARELLEWRGNLSTTPDLETKLEGAAFMIRWIADGLEREFVLAAERGRKLQTALGTGENDANNV